MTSSRSQAPHDQPTSWPADVCLLPMADRPARTAEWSALLVTAATDVSRVDPNRARFALRPEPDVAARTADLASREACCCSFFTFRLNLTAGALSLDVSVPVERIDVLDAFVQVASSEAETVLAQS